jgi:hypothetical protein
LALWNQRDAGDRRFAASESDQKLWRRAQLRCPAHGMGMRGVERRNRRRARREYEKYGYRKSQSVAPRLEVFRPGESSPDFMNSALLSATEMSKRLK